MVLWILHNVCVPVRLEVHRNQWHYFHVCLVRNFSTSWKIEYRFASWCNGFFKTLLQYLTTQLWTFPLLYIHTCTQRCTVPFLSHGPACRQPTYCAFAYDFSLGSNWAASFTWPVGFVFHSSHKSFQHDVSLQWVWRS